MKCVLKDKGDLIMVEFSHKIVKGDNLSNIAKTHGTNMQQILNDNPQFRSNPNLIFEGQEVKMDSDKLLEEGFTCPGCHLEHADEPCPEGAEGTEGAPSPEPTAAPAADGFSGTAMASAGMVAAGAGLVVGASYADELKAGFKGAKDATVKFGQNAWTKTKTGFVNSFKLAEEDAQALEKAKGKAKYDAHRAQVNAEGKTVTYQDAVRKNGEVQRYKVDITDEKGNVIHKKGDVRMRERTKVVRHSIEENKNLAKGLSKDGTRALPGGKSAAQVKTAQEQLRWQRNLQRTARMSKAKTFTTGAKGILKTRGGKAGLLIAAGIATYELLK